MSEQADLATIDDYEEIDVPMRDSLPHEVYGERADYVRLAMKAMTAKRLVGWLREFANRQYELGNDTTADHARNVANRLESEVVR